MDQANKKQSKTIDQKIELNEDYRQLRNIEYEQICEDWRHRDSMTWQSLAVSITITGIIFSFVSQLTWERVFLFLFSFLLNFTILLRITKDHYYQLGSIEALLYKLDGSILIEKLFNHGTLSRYREEYNMRRQAPSEKFFRDAVNEKKVPFPFLYEKVMLKISAFKLYILTQMILVLISLGSFIYELIFSIIRLIPSIQKMISFL